MICRPLVRHSSRPTCQPQTVIRSDKGRSDQPPYSGRSHKPVDRCRTWISSPFAGLHEQASYLSLSSATLAECLVVAAKADDVIQGVSVCPKQTCRYTVARVLDAFR